MNNFKKEGFRKGNSGFGGKPKFGGGNKFGGGSRGGDRGFDRGGRPGGDREMFKTVCDSCHKDCEVPFRPTGDKPVYCRDCFGKNDGDDSRSFNRTDSRGSDFRRDSRPQYDARPARREESSAPRDGGLEEMKRKLTILDTKLETILQMLKGNTGSHTEPVPTVKMKVVDLDTTSKAAPKVAVKLEKKVEVVKEAAKPAAKKEAKAPAKEKTPAKKVAAKKAPAAKAAKKVAKKAK